MRSLAPAPVAARPASSAGRTPALAATTQAYSGYHLIPSRPVIASHVAPALVGVDVLSDDDQGSRMR